MLRTLCTLTLVALTTSTLTADETVYRTGRTTYQLPFDLPTRGEVIQAAGFGSSDANVEVRLLELAKANPRFYPMVGPAILETAVFACEVEENGRSVRVAIDRSRFLRAHSNNTLNTEATP